MQGMEKQKTSCCCTRLSDFLLYFYQFAIFRFIGFGRKHKDIVNMINFEHCRNYDVELNTDRIVMTFSGRIDSTGWTDVEDDDSGLRSLVFRDENGFPVVEITEYKY